MALREREVCCRVISVLAGALVALPARAYLPSSSALLARAAQRRVETRLPGLEATGELTVRGEAARELASALGLEEPRPPEQLSLPAAIQLKGPGRCRLEVAPPPAALPPVAPAAARSPAPLKGAAAATPRPGSGHPAFALRPGPPAASHGLESVAAVRAMVEGLCVLLGDGPGGASEVERALAQRLAAHGISLQEVALGHLGMRVAWVIGGMPPPRPATSELVAVRAPSAAPTSALQAPFPTPLVQAAPEAPREPAPAPAPQVWLDKESFQPVRLLAPLAGAPRDVRLLDIGLSPGTEAFPRAVEVWAGETGEARFDTDRVTPAPKLPDALF